MAINEELVQRYEREIIFDWFEALDISHSDFTGDGHYYIHNGFTENSIICNVGPYDPVQNEYFFAAPFQVSLPTRDGEGRGDITVNFSFPQTVISEQLELALTNPLEPVSLRYTCFLYSTRRVPLYDPWLQFYATEVSTNENTVSVTGQISDLVNRHFPDGVYTGRNFPGLNRR